MDAFKEEAAVSCAYRSCVNVSLEDNKLMYSFIHSFLEENRKTKQTYLKESQIFMLKFIMIYYNL